MKVILAILFFASAVQATSDADLAQFIVGKWKFADASCLSGAVPHWEENPKDYDYQMKFSANRRVQIKEFHKSQLASAAQGSYSIQNANLALNSMKTCHYYPDSTSCSSQGASTFLLSIQGAQLWLLSNEGDDAGVCPARDVFTAKYERK